MKNEIRFSNSPLIIKPSTQNRFLRTNFQIRFSIFVVHLVLYVTLYVLVFIKPSTQFSLQCQKKNQFQFSIFLSSSSVYANKIKSITLSAHRSLVLIIKRMSFHTFKQSTSNLKYKCECVCLVIL